jgi:hypothetical protein
LDILMLWGLALAAIAAVVIGLSTRLIVLRTGQHAEAQATLADAKEDKLSGELKEKNRQIAALDAKAKEAEGGIETAKANAAGANAKAEGFRLDIAKSNEAAVQPQAQGAGTMAEAAKANLELAKLKTPRNLTPEQREHIRAAISQFSGTPYDLWVSTDSDSAALLEQIDAHTEGHFAGFGSAIPDGLVGPSPWRSRRST